MAEGLNDFQVDVLVVGAGNAAACAALAVSHPNNSQWLACKRWLGIAVSHLLNS